MGIIFEGRGEAKCPQGKAMEDKQVGRSPCDYDSVAVRGQSYFNNSIFLVSI